jgi:hypothetical protein
VFPLSTPQDFKVTSGPEKRDRKLVLRADTEAKRDEWVKCIRQGISAIRELERTFEQEFGEKRSAKTYNASKELTRLLNIRRQKSDIIVTDESQQHHKAKAEAEILETMGCTKSKEAAADGITSPGDVGIRVHLSSFGAGSHVDLDNVDDTVIAQELTGSSRAGKAVEASTVSAAPAIQKATSQHDARHSAMQIHDTELVRFDFTAFRAKKCEQHMPGTREWVFQSILQWKEEPAETVQAFWLMGSGGTGKTVVAAVLLDRLRDDAVAWHFCQHDNSSQSEPADVIRSLAVMLSASMPEFGAELRKQDYSAIKLAANSNEIDDVFDTLLSIPLQELEPPASPKIIVIDALDELPKGLPLVHMLRLITEYFPLLPSWIRLFITSRSESQIKNALQTKVLVSSVSHNNKPC